MFYCVVKAGEVIAGGIEYAIAVDLLNAECADWESLGGRVEYGWASAGNYAAAKALPRIPRDPETGRIVKAERKCWYIAIEADDDDTEE